MNSSDLTFRDVLMGADLDSFDLVILSMVLKTEHDFDVVQISVSFPVSRLDMIRLPIYHCPVHYHRIDNDRILWVVFDYDPIISKLMKEGDVYA